MATDSPTLLHGMLAATGGKWFWWNATTAQFEGPYISALIAREAAKAWTEGYETGKGALR